MGKKGKMPDMNLPIWFDGQNINEALFCEEFLRERRIIFANGAFFTPDGRVTDDLPLRGEIYDKLKCSVRMYAAFTPVFSHYRKQRLSETTCFRVLKINGNGNSKVFDRRTKLFHEIVLL